MKEEKNTVFLSFVDIESNTIKFVCNLFMIKNYLNILNFKTILLNVTFIILAEGLKILENENESM